MTQPPFQPNYQSQGAQFGVRPRVNGLAVASFVLGILSLLAVIMGGALLGVVAIILGAIAIPIINKNPLAYGGKAFAWIGLSLGIASVVFTVLIIPMLLPSLGRAREISNRAYCAANLAGILKAANVYAADNRSDFPIALPPKGSIVSFGGGVPVASTADLTLESMYKSGGPTDGNMSANLWILVIRGYVAPKSFICKSDPNTPAVAFVTSSGNYLNNFDGVQNFSYSFAIPWQAGGKKLDFWKDIADPYLPLMADQAPLDGDLFAGGKVSVTARPSDPKLWNSPMHGGDGQTVGWSDAHASFEKSPNVGYTNDNIWTTTGGRGPSENGNRPAYGPGIERGNFSRSIADYPDAGSAGAIDIYMAPARGRDGKTY